METKSKWVEVGKKRNLDDFLPSYLLRGDSFKSHQCLVCLAVAGHIKAEPPPFLEG